VSAAQSKPWFRQAESDLRVAEALRQMPSPMQAEDTGCHLAAMCAQTIEKAIKGYMIVNGSSPRMDHRPDKYLKLLLRKDEPLLRHKGHYPHLSKLFDNQVRSVVATLLGLNPGGSGGRVDVPNTEYPWQKDGVWRETPTGSPHFADNLVDDWIRLARRIWNGLAKLAIAAERGRP
jgi:hypothetical protein